MLPHVYTSSSITQNHAFSSFGAKYMLPLGTTRQMYDVSAYSHFFFFVLISYQDYEEVILPPAKTVPPRASERLIPCSELPPLARGSFGVCKSGWFPPQSLNDIPGLYHSQSDTVNCISYSLQDKREHAHLRCEASVHSLSNSDQSIAPTGAGKTDVAMLSILRTVDLHRKLGGSDVAATVQHDKFKIIYV